MDTVFFYHPIYLEHDNDPHPESPARLRVIMDRIQQAFGDELVVVEPEAATMEDLVGIHDRAYLEGVEKMCKKGGGYIDGDTSVVARSFEAALYAAGAMKGCADGLMKKRTRSAFGLVRPPGHHALPAKGMGFCIVNNIAVAAEYLMKHHGIKKVLIADFDVHHGNGTQDIFYESASVFFLSIHRVPFYPGTGGVNEKGEGEGKSTTLNLPIMFGTKPEEFVKSFVQNLQLSAEAHKPELLLISAGFDAYAEDPVGGLGLQPEHYKSIGEAIRRVADRFCEGRVLSALEGGYSLSGLPACLEAYVRGLEISG